MTFSIAGWCARTGMAGIAVSTSSISVGSRCPWVRAGVGAVATQNVTLPSLGDAVLDGMARGLDAGAAVSEALAGDRHARYRQVVAVDRRGGTGHFTGAKALGVHAVAAGRHCVAGGNLLADRSVPGAMAAAFAESPGAPLAERLMAALEAGSVAGGETVATRSAALLVAHEQSWPLVDLRVDWDKGDPVATLRGLWTAYAPVSDEYLLRALDPDRAPPFGVPGEE